MTENDGFYYCDCPRHCKKRKKVSSATWYNHAKYRNTITTTFSAFEAETAGTSSAPRLPAEQPQPHIHPVPPKKKRRLNRVDKHDTGEASGQNEVNFMPECHQHLTNISSE
jgi:hypothetical protein